jgi:hypothetical protein
MLLQTNSYIVPKEKRTEHARLLQRFRQLLARLGCDHFEAYEQVGVNWGGGEPTGRFVQIMRFRDKKHQQAVQSAERVDPDAQALIKEFCELINFPYQQQQGLFAVGFYNSVLPVTPLRTPPRVSEPEAFSPAPEPPAPEAATDTPEPADHLTGVDSSAEDLPPDHLPTDDTDVIDDSPADEIDDTVDTNESDDPDEPATDSPPRPNRHHLN